VITVGVAKGSSPSPAREHAEPNIQDSTNKGRRRPSKHHKIRNGGNITEAMRRLGSWGSELKSGRRRRGCTKNDWFRHLYSDDFDKNKLPTLEPVSL